MTKANKLSRTLCLLLAVLLVLGLAVLPTPASAAQIGTGKTLFELTIYTTNDTDAGTDANIYFRAYYSGSKYDSVKLDNSGNDFEAGSTGEYSVTFNHPLYHYDHFTLYNDGANAAAGWRVGSVTISTFTVSSSGGHSTLKTFSKDSPQWIEEGQEYTISNPYKTRSVDGALDSFNNSMSGSSVISSANSASVTWKPSLNDGIYDAYNPFDYDDPPKFEYKVYAAVNGSNPYDEVTNRYVTNNQSTTFFSDASSDIGFTYYPSRLLTQMKQDGYFALKVESKLNFPKEGKSITAEYFIYRNEFAVGAAPVVDESYYTAAQDNYFFNSDPSHQNIVIYLPIVSDQLHSNYIASDIVQMMTADEIKLFYGQTENAYLSGSRDGYFFDSSNGVYYARVIFSAAGTEYENVSGSDGLKLYMKNVRTTDGWYQLYNTVASAPLYGTTSVTLASNDYYFFLSQYKLDTIPPSISVREKQDSGSEQFSGKWQQRATLITSTQNTSSNSAETLYVDGRQGYLKLELPKADGSGMAQFYEVNSSSSSAAAQWYLPSGLTRETTITLPGGNETVLNVKVTGSDFAGNQYTHTYERALYLDTLAPVVGVSSSTGSPLSDKSRNYTFTFSVTEGTNTARVNYCVVRAVNNAIPDVPAENTWQPSGAINDLLGQWAYVEQASGNLTAVLKLQENETFDGAIYYYAVDEAGNSSKNPNYQMMEIHLSNVAATAEVEVSAFDHPLPNYAIRLIPGPGSTVETYRYSRKNADGTFDPVTGWIAYPSSGIIGSGLVNGSTLLNGTYVLEYTVSNAASGNTATYAGIAGYELVFDNSDPELELTRTSTGSSLAVQTFRLNAGDISGIASAQYEVKVDGSDTVAASGTLPIADGTYLLSTDLSTMEMGLPNGAYTLTLYATDYNNTTVSKTSPAFTVRTQAPAAEITLNGSPITGVMAVNDPAYQLELTVADAFQGTPGNQSVYWRASDGGSEYTPWQRLADMTASNGTLTAAGVLTAPVALADGLNTVRIQILCAESDKNMSVESEISTAGILTLDPDPLYILLDTTAPTAVWNATSQRSTTTLTGTLTVSDDYAAAPAVTAFTSGLIIAPAEGEQNKYSVEYTLPAGEAKPDALVAAIADDAGNVNYFAIATDLLDIEGPEIVIGAPTYQAYGDRQDAVVIVTITEEYPGSVDFDLDPAASAYARISQESDGVYKVQLMGYTGDMPFSVTATDDLGNVTTAVSDNIDVILPELTQPHILSAPAYAYDSALTLLGFDLPAVAAATEEEALALAEEAVTKPADYLKGSCLLIPNVLGEGKQACTIWLADGFGNTRSFTLTPDTIFGRDLPVTVTLEQYLDGVRTGGTVNALVAGTHIADPSDPADSTHTYTALVVVEADAMAEPHALLPYTILPEGDDRAGSSYPDPNGEDPDPSKIRSAAFDPTDYDDKNTLLNLLTTAPETEFDPYGISYRIFDGAFSRMSFQVLSSDAVTENLPSATLNIGAYIQGSSAAGTEEPDAGLTQNVYIRTPHYDAQAFSGIYAIGDDTAPPEAYTLKAAISADDVWLNKSLTIDVPFITVSPEITYNFWQNTIAPEVHINANAAGTKIVLFKLLRQEADGSWTAVSSWTDDGSGIGPTIMYDVPEEEAGFYCLYAASEYGLSTLSETFEITVYTEPIDETDFTVSIYAAVDGGQVLVTGEEPYSNSVTVRIGLTDEGIERGLYASNCPSLEAVLTPDSPSFTFNLTDMYGYMLDVPVSYSHFDVTAPTVDHRLPDVGKTNQAYDVEITAEDGESGIRSVTLSGPNGSIVLEEADGIWTGQVAVNGSYLITAEDMLGNRTQRTFLVTNIDMTLPNVYITRSIPEDVLTLQPVTISLSFDKPNVLITKVEKASGELTQNKTAKTLTFSKNGAATVYYRDDYGNEGRVLVTVNNIYSEPPHLAAVPVLSEDELSVSVTFVMERGADGVPLDLVRDLSQLTVIHNGVAYRADEAVYLLGDNGTYTFTVVDEVGLMQVIKLTVTDIDRSAPRITEVRWTYVYYDNEGRRQNAAYNLRDIQGSGYRIASDLYPMTNQNVTVTVTTDVPTSILGSYGEERTTDHTLIYYENGMYIYNLQKRNGLSEHYGVDVEIIDKTPPAITLENPEYLMFIENRDTGDFTAMLNDYKAIDTYLGIETDLTDAVTVDYGGLIVDDLSQNTFDKSHPYTITYSVKDAAGNEMTVTRTVVLIGINDVLVTVNGRLPSASSMAEVRDGNVKLEIINFSGTAYVTYAKGMYTFGQMKRTGSLLPPQADGSFQLNGLKEGWYTFFVQTETRDYFNIYVYVG